MRVLILETTCDETAAALVTDQLEVLGEVVASQHQLHQRYQGVVPEIAARAHLERILPVIDQTLAQAQVTLQEVDAIAVANTPGLAGSLMVGLMAAKTLAMVLEKPLVAVNHLHGHIYACRIAAGREIFPCIGFIVSGGHTNLYRCDGPCDFHYLGGTIDDAAGEVFDKVAAMLGLPFPGGPALSKLAETGDPQAYRFPRPLLDDPERLDFSFSGLKTAVRYTIAGTGRVDFSRLDLSPQQKADVAASFQEAVVDCLATKAALAMERSDLDRLCVGGGVAANQRFRARLQELADQRGWDLIIAPPRLCTDNAVMGAVAIEHLRAGRVAGLDLDIQPGLVRR